MSKYGEIRKMERQVRSSVAYADWVVRNKAAACLCCGATKDLELHHLVELHQLVLGLWKLYGDEADVVAHALAAHQDDRVESVTVCAACHGKRHPGRVARRFDPSVNVADWAAVPRRLRFPFSQSTAARTRSSVGLVGFQVLIAVGWYVLKGHMDARMVHAHRRRLAELLGKSPGTSFNASLEEALESLRRLDVLLAWCRKGNDVELHLSPSYLRSLGENPWFMPLDDARTSSMCVLTLRWFLGTQSNRKTYRIGLDKLKAHLGMTVRNGSMAALALRRACGKVRWAKLEIKNGMCHFSISRKGATPVFSLRRALADALEQGR